MADNQQQIDYWNADAGQTWVETQERLDQMFAPLTAQALDKAAPKAGERAIDVGCGCGDTTLAMAAAGANVWGIDISKPMLARARERAQDLPNVRFTEADAAHFDFSPEHALLFSRFGVMFFDDPARAFANLRTSLTDDGRLVFICWQKPTANPWMSVAGRAVQPFLPEPESPPDPTAPGPFAFADRDYLASTLGDAGFANIDITSATATLHVADDLDSAIALLGRVGPVARALKELEGSQLENAVRAAREALDTHTTASGLELGAAVWLVDARSP